MLKVPQLDDLAYEQIIQKAVSRIPSMTDEWTDFNSHDPGITVLQTYAWLIDMLNYYLNATGDVHIEKYLKLLGIEPIPEKSAVGYVWIQSDAQIIPKGTRLLAGDIPFETVADSQGDRNRFCSFINEVDGTGNDLTAFAGIDGEYAEGFAQGFLEQAVLYLGFLNPLETGDRLYICVEENKKRNPFEKDFCLSELKWQVHTKNGWSDIEVEDETCGFLRTGFITVNFSEEMEEYHHPAGIGKAFYLRCILKEDTYDVLPQIGMIYVNLITVVQQRTICQMGEIRPEFRIGSTNGCAGQELLFDYPDIGSFSLAIEQEKEGWEIWNCTKNLSQSDYKEKVFEYDRERQVVRFGDGIHGAVPGQQKAIYVTGLICSKFAGGNVLPREIKTFEEPRFESDTVENPKAVCGGRDRESVEEMLVRMEETLFQQQRMASISDYEEIVRGTPGLMLELVHVIPGLVYGDLHRQNRSANEVVVVVKPYSTENRPDLSLVYQKKIENYIEPYRMLNTKVSIVQPSYVGIKVYGKIELYQDTEDSRKAVMECLKNMIDYNRLRKPFGAAIYYGRIFAKLETMEEIAQVQELSLERVGSAAIKNERGDILLQEDALSFMEDAEIIFI